MVDTELQSIIDMVQQAHARFSEYAKKIGPTEELNTIDLAFKLFVSRLHYLEVVHKGHPVSAGARDDTRMADATQQAKPSPPGKSNT